MQEQQRYVWKPRDWDPEQTEPLHIGYVPPVLGMHRETGDMPLIPARLTVATDPAVKFVITAGQPFDTQDEWMIRYCRTDRSFRRA